MQKPRPKPLIKASSDVFKITPVICFGFKMANFAKGAKFASLVLICQTDKWPSDFSVTAEKKSVNDGK